MDSVYVMGTGAYLPEKVITNADLAQRIDTTDQWITSRTGIHQRHVVSEGESSLTLAYEASQRALAAADIEAKSLDLILVATMTPADFMPSTACQLQGLLGVQCMALDLNAACSGFMYALSGAQA